MNILFVHQNFPGQFKHLAPAMARQGHRVVALHINACPPVPGVALVRYAVTARPGEGTEYSIPAGTYTLDELPEHGEIIAGFHGTKHTNSYKEPQCT